MNFILSSQNISDYLAKVGLLDRGDLDSIAVTPQLAKNFNLLVSFPDGKQLIVKQERPDRMGKTAGEFLHEWYLRELIQSYPELVEIAYLLPTIVHCDRENSILAIEYLSDYLDLNAFYASYRNFDPAIGTKIGQAIGQIHQLTYRKSAYQNFFNDRGSRSTIEQLIATTQILTPLTPELYSQLPTAGIKFLSLCQRYESMTEAVKELVTNFQPCCVTHNDFKLSNILLDRHWEHRDRFPLKAIDWERCGWGDPAVDLGFAIASYLQMWLTSTIVNPTIKIEDSLRMATLPLDRLQPSIAAIIRAYLATFPAIDADEPNFLLRVIQWTGIALIHQVQATIQYHKSLDNTGIATLQVAKSLLCRPESSMKTLIVDSE